MASSLFTAFLIAICGVVGVTCFVISLYTLFRDDIFPDS